MDKKMYKYMGMLVGIIILLIVFFLITGSMGKNSSKSYDSIEKKLVKAAKKYTKEHSGVLPSNEGQSITITYSQLSNAGYISDISKGDVACNGSVDVYLSSNGNYDYVPDLHCGGKYNSVKLADQVIEDNGYGVTGGSGLYLRADGKFITDERVLDELDLGNYKTFEYVFRGENVNNFVKIDDNYWRIVNINEENDMMLIYQGHSQKAFAWDDRYNESTNKPQGINDYYVNGNKSRILDTLEKFYTGDIVLVDKEPLSKKLRYITSPFTLCVGKRDAADSSLDGSTECSQKLENQNIGLLPAYYYMSASTDLNCDSITSKNCGNFNYLSTFKNEWWLVTANKENTNEAYRIAKTYSEPTLCYAKNYIRPIVVLGSRVIYEGGTGTLNNPYTIKYFNDEE